jgi:integrase
VSRQQKILTQEETEQLIEGARNNEQQTSLSNRFDEMLIRTCLWHGLRNEETVTLQRKHINFKNTGVSIELENTKTEDGVRFVPTVGHFEEEFLDWVEAQTDEEEDYLFPSPRSSNHISTRYFQNMMLDLAWNLGFYPHLDSKEQVKNEIPEEKRVRPHALRHTYGTRMYENEVKPKKLSEVMGHAKLEITMDLYAHLSTERSRDELSEAASNWD